MEYSFDELEGEALDFALAEAALVDDHLIHQLVEVDIAVLEHQEDAFCLHPHHHFLQVDDVGMAAEQSQYLHLAQRGHGEAILVVQHLHLLYCQLFLRGLISRVKDDTVGTLPNHLSLLVLSYEPAVQRLHMMIY